MNPEEVGLLTPKTRKAKQSKEPEEVEGDLRPIEKPMEKNSIQFLKTAAEIEAELAAEEYRVKFGKIPHHQRVMEDHSF